MNFTLYLVVPSQELCYLCMQRANSNVPVYLREQQQAEEKVQERLLLLKEQQKDKLFMEKEQVGHIFFFISLICVQ